MLHGIIMEQGHLLDMRGGISGKMFSHVFLLASSLWCLNPRY